MHGRGHRGQVPSHPSPKHRRRRGLICEHHPGVDSPHEGVYENGTFRDHGSLSSRDAARGDRDPLRENG